MPARRMEALITIREAVLAIQKRDYLLPAIQREYGWGAEKTESLFDSLIRGYCQINSEMRCQRVEQ